MNLNAYVVHDVSPVMVTLADLPSTILERETLFTEVLSLSVTVMVFGSDVLTVNMTVVVVIFGFPTESLVCTVLMTIFLLAPRLVVGTKLVMRVLSASLSA